MRLRELAGIAIFGLLAACTENKKPPPPTTEPQPSASAQAPTVAGPCAADASVDPEYWDNSAEVFYHLARASHTQSEFPPLRKDKRYAEIIAKVKTEQK